MTKIYVNPETFIRLRILKGMSQRELARQSQLSNAYISLLERSMKTIGPAAAKKLSDALETPMDELFHIG
ncbi:helix-turn-helix domain-containing protein [Gorillibacterium massiliense]|uniref:helix-turn-helix domain-containing protein n=1 Tax=Gorillibacterium massiliense TaxID=1280390 RepID=UPI0004AEB5C3|nr:helix-turn-helix transcriptional regulator [Gorillibacterium massiliense]